ncbi:type II toxin-antitoxin system VapC family toxin [Allohahella marinimesophila]|uniref:Type II toxin-antitoxin system VapC family toxin n=1 Tax=Allohahella marinimesophila TaxID=1054972 RepID=A0ABP7NRJ3_9GAMM
MILLDTCAIIWDALDRSKLTGEASAAIAKADEHNALIICDISIWEIAMLIQRDRIKVECTAANFIDLYLASRNLAVVTISPEIAELSTSFGQEINNDPADRIIAATSIIHNAQLVTADMNLRQSSLVDTIW